MRLSEVTFSSRGAIGGLLVMVVTVIECSAVYGASGVGNFAAVLYFSPNLEFSFATPAAAPNET